MPVDLDRGDERRQAPDWDPFILWNLLIDAEVSDEGTVLPHQSAASFTDSNFDSGS